MAGWLILLTSFKCYVLDLFFTPVVVAISQDEVPTSDESSWQEILSNIFVVLGCLLLVVQTENFTSFSNLLSTPKEIQPQGKIIKVTPLPKVEGVIQQYQVEYKNGVTIKTFNKPDEQN